MSHNPWSLKKYKVVEWQTNAPTPPPTNPPACFSWPVTYEIWVIMGHCSYLWTPMLCLHDMGCWQWPQESQQAEDCMTYCLKSVWLHLLGRLQLKLLLVSIFYKHFKAFTKTTSHESDESKREGWNNDKCALGLEACCYTLPSSCPAL